MLWKQKRIVNRALLDEIKSRPCIECGSRYNVDPSHIMPVSLGGHDISLNCVPHCRPCHSEWHRLGRVRAFESMRRTREYLEKFGWRIENIVGKKYLVNDSLNGEEHHE